MDVKTTFLNNDLEEKINMNQPEGCVVDGQENKVCKILKSLYGLKQESKQWHEKFNETLLVIYRLFGSLPSCLSDHLVFHMFL